MLRLRSEWGCSTLKPLWGHYQGDRANGVRDVKRLNSWDLQRPEPHCCPS